MSKYTLVVNLEDAFVGWKIKEEDSVSGEGIDIVCRPLGMNPVATEIIRNINPKFIKVVDSSKVLNGAYNLMLITSRSSDGVVTRAVKELNIELGAMLENTTEKLKVVTSIAKTKELKHKRDMASEIEDRLKQIRERKQTGFVRREVEQ